jgi:hypothetical protein
VHLLNRMIQNFDYSLHCLVYTSGLWNLNPVIHVETPAMRQVSMPT